MFTNKREAATETEWKKKEKKGVFRILKTFCISNLKSGKSKVDEFVTVRDSLFSPLFTVVRDNKQWCFYHIYRVVRLLYSKEWFPNLIGQLTRWCEDIFRKRVYSRPLFYHIPVHINISQREFTRGQSDDDEDLFTVNILQYLRSIVYMIGRSSSIQYTYCSSRQ
jgi:hypothetical protein